MKLLIDNGDGRGAVDYSGAVAPGSLEVTRVLNKPSTAAAGVCLLGTALAVPVRRGRVSVESGFALQVDAGTAPPAGGGFEVRRRDGGWGQAVTPGTAGDLLLRSPVRGFQIPVASVGEQFFIRMYDGSSPALYSRESSVLVTHLPVVS